jgi:VWFA-related protein
MKSVWVFILIFALAVASNLPCLAQNPAGQEPDDDERLVVGTNEVVLDAVVKDKKGHAVKDLKPSDFEVFEDGVRQEVKSFRLVIRETGTANSEQAKGETAATTATGEPQPAVGPRRNVGSAARTSRTSAVALVFDRLSPDARKRAREAALAYLGSEIRPDDFVGVFGIDLSLRAAQPFTNDTQLVRQAVERITGQNSATHAASTQQITDLTQRQSQADANNANLARDRKSVV